MYVTRRRKRSANIRRYAMIKMTWQTSKQNHSTLSSQRVTFLSSPTMHTHHDHQAPAHNTLNEHHTFTFACCCGDGRINSSDSNFIQSTYIYYSVIIYIFLPTSFVCHLSIANEYSVSVPVVRTSNIVIHARRTSRSVRL